MYLNTWRQDDTFRQPELMSIFLDVLREGREKGVLTDELEEIELLDMLLGVVSRTTTMWFIRGSQDSLIGKAPALFEGLWRAIARPDYGAATSA